MDVVSASRSGVRFVPTWLESVVQKIARLITKSFGEAHFASKEEGANDGIEVSDVGSLYRLARLLAANDVQAQELVVGAYTIAATSPYSYDNAAQLRRQLFGALHQVFQQNRAKYEKPAVTQNSPAADNDLASIRRLVGGQDPLVRCLIFLRHCENLSIGEISQITGCPADAIRTSLLSFRNVCSDLRRATLTRATA